LPRRRRGELIGAFDALTLGVTLVSNNTKHFQRVAGLKTATWADPA